MAKTNIRVRIIGADGNVFNLLGICDSYSIAKADFLHAGINIVLKEIHNNVRILILSFERTAKGCCQINYDIKIRVS